MKLALKLTLAVAVAILAVMAAYDYLLVTEEVTLFEADLERMAHPGRRLGAAMEAVWRAYGEERAQRVLETMDAGVSDLSVRWRWIDAPKGDARRVDAPAGVLDTLRRGQIASFIVRDDPTNPQRHTFVPMSVEGGRPAALELTESLRREYAFIATTHRKIVITSLIILGLCATAVMSLGFWFVGRPIRLLRDKARGIGAGRRTDPLTLRQRDEIGELAADINAMCDRLSEAQQALAAETEARIAAIEQMRHTDRLTTLGQLASGIAHELGTPLNVISGRAEMIALGEAQGAAIAENARIVLEQANLMTALIRQLLDLSRRRTLRFGVASLQAIAARTVDLLASYARPRGVTVELVAGDQPAFVSVDESQLQQALTNVVMNGLQAMPAGGRLTVRVDTRAARRPDDPGAPEREYPCVTVEDEGEGIPPENLEQIFEPFFTTKGTGEGTGLGLSVSYGIVREHGGWMTVESEVGRGSRFSIFLERAAGAPSVEVAS
jgi:two-component system NtrC family sensor kinase